MNDRVLERIRQARCTIIDAPSGFGKSEVLSSLATRVDPVEWLDGAQALGSPRPGDRGWKLLDDARGDDEQLGGWVDHLLRASPDIRLVVTGRGLGPGCRAIGRRDGNDLIEAFDLELTVEEITKLLTAAGGDTGAIDGTAQAIGRACAGWPALGRELVRIEAGGAGLTVVDGGTIAQGPVVLDSLVGPALARLDDDTARLAHQLAHLPTIDDGILDALDGVDLGRRLVQAGLPLMRTSGAGTYRLPAALGSVMARRSTLDPDVAARVAPVLVERGMAIEATRLFLRGDRPQLAARLVADLPVATVDGLDADDFASILELLETTVDRYPRLLLLRARAESGRARLDTQRQLLGRAAAASTGDEPERVRAEADAELLFLDALESTEPAEASDLTSRIELAIESCKDDDDRNRTRLTEALGVVMAGDERPTSLEEASLLLDRAARRWEHLGERRQAAGTLRLLCMQALIPLGRYQEGEAAMAKAALLGGDGMVEQARNVVVQTRLAALAGAPDAFTRIDTADRLARNLGLQWLRGYACWSRMLAEAVSGRAENVALLQERAWSELGGLRAHATGHVFLCESATALARVGEIERARSVLDEALARRAEGALELDLAELAVLARSASVDLVRSRADQLLLSGRVPAARRWSVLLSLAVAADRAGNADAPGDGGESIARRAALEAGLCGLPELPSRLEPNLYRPLPPSPTTAEAGAAPVGSSGELTVRVFGRFSIRQGDRAVTVTSAKAAQMAKLLAVRDGSAPVDLVIEALWPEVEPDVGRRRLKNVVSRARADLGPVVIRERERMAFTSAVSIDLRDFELAARRAVLLAQTDPDGALDAAMQALSLYRGDLLQDDLYDDWSEGPRTETRGRALALIDLVRSGNDLSARPSVVAALVEAVLRVDPTDTARLSDLESLSLDVGNRAAARAARNQLDHHRPL